uniref:Uncharacterized protein n=1 Tax=Romanomermis culicivorax TaxID=13658 RepID=A0A915KGL1_ROMCU
MIFTFEIVPEINKLGNVTFEIKIVNSEAVFFM